MITTSDAELAERARTLRFHGSHDKVTYEQIGYNSRLDELQAAILRVQLPHLDGWADGRRRGGRALRARPGSGELVTLPVPIAGRSARLAPVRRRPPRGRARLEAALRAAEIGYKAYYRTAGPPPGRDARVGRRRRAARHRRGGAHAPRDPDEPGAHARPGRGGRGGGASALSRTLGPRRPAQRQRSSRSSSRTSRTTRAGTPITTARAGTSRVTHGAGGDERLLADLDPGSQHRAAADAAGAPQRRAAQGVVRAVAAHRVVVGRASRPGRRRRRPRRRVNAVR